MGCGHVDNSPQTPSCPHAHSPYDGEVVLFSIIKWPSFRLSRFRRGAQSGPLFDHQVALFSVDKHKFLDAYRNPVGLSYALFYNGDTYVMRDA